ncbi:MAG: DUF2238 domain-containing protein [Candidatus Woesearchaeota archaeon]|nr:DUF2238 domain-containing protein [Candidatus Woesearchaeota archaeon]
MKRYPHSLLIIYVVFWAALAVSPANRFDWFLENILVFISIPVLLWTYVKFRLSNRSYTLIFIFMVLHTIGSHYQYAGVPFGFWLQDLFELSRNHYDRIVHFSYGLLLAYPVRELFLRLATVRSSWSYWFPIELTLAFSALFEIIEWLVTIIVSPEAGAAYLGIQGDEWDAQKDMALAGLGAVLSMCVTALVQNDK